MMYACGVHTCLCAFFFGKPQEFSAELLRGGYLADPAIQTALYHLSRGSSRDHRATLAALFARPGGVPCVGGNFNQH